jgi:tetratricopeptide (TPR) repeat protein
MSHLREDISQFLEEARGYALDEDLLSSLGVLNHARGILQDAGEMLTYEMSIVLEAIGENYIAQDLENEAIIYFEKSLAIREAISAVETIETGELFCKTAELLGAEGQFDQAEEYSLRSLQILEVFEPNTNETISTLKHNLGIILFSKNESDRALPFLESARDLRREIYGELSEQVFETNQGLQHIYSTLSMNNELLSCLENSITFAQGYWGKDAEEVDELQRKYRALTGFDFINTQNEKSSIKDSSDSIISALIIASIEAIHSKQHNVAVEILELSRKLLNNSSENQSHVDESIVNSIRSMLEQNES